MSQENKNPLLHSKIHEVWKRSQMLHTLLGALLFFRWVIVLWIIAVCLDWLFDLPGAVRGVGTLIIAGISFSKAWSLAWNKLSEYDPVQTALKVEEHFGNLKSILVTAIQFGSSKQNAGSEELCQVTCNRAEKVVKDLPTEKTVDLNELKQPSLIASGIVLVIFIFALLGTEFFKVSIQRFITPWVAVSYPTRTQINLAETDMIVKEGDALQIKIGLSGEIPDEATISLRTDEGKPRDHFLKVKEEACAYDVHSVFRSFQYRVKAGDAKSSWYSVKVISAPKILEAKTTIEYPKYTMKANVTNESLTLTMPEGSMVRWELKLDQQLKQAFFYREGEDPIELKLSEDGRVATLLTKVSESKAYHFKWIEKIKGYTFNSSKHFLQVAPDKAPRVEMVNPGEDLNAIIGRKLDLAFLASDDFGIAEASIVYRLNNADPVVVKLNLNKIENNAVTQCDWDYRNVLKDIKIGDVLRVGVEVRDHFPSEQGGNLTRSRMRRITFMTEEDYIMHLERRRKKLLAKLRTIYRQERESYEVVSGLDLGSEDLHETCMLESVRHDLIMERMQAVRDRIHFFVEDIKANNIKSDFQSNELLKLSAQLKLISQNHVAVAGEKLRLLSLKRDISEADFDSATRSINEAAHELASLVLKLSISDATEVLVRELLTAVHIQTLLHLDSLAEQSPNSEQAKAMADEQKRLSAYLSRLFYELTHEPDYSQPAIQLLKMSRIVKGLKKENIESRMLALAKSFEAGKFKETLVEQENILNHLKGVVYRLKTRAELEALKKTHTVLLGLWTEQSQLMKMTEASDLSSNRDAIVKSQNKMITALRKVILPRIPMKRQSMMDEGFPQDIKASEVYISIMESMKQSNQFNLAQNKDASLKSQKTSMEQIDLLISLVKTRMEEVAQFGDLFTMLFEIEGRLVKSKDFSARQSSIMEQTEDLVDDEKSVKILVDQQKLLASEVKALLERVEASLDQSKFTGYTAASLEPLKSITENMSKLIELFNQNKGDDSFEVQEQIIALLKDINTLCSEEIGMIVQLSQTVIHEEEMRKNNQGFADITEEQRDIETEAKTASKSKLIAMAPAQRYLATCLQSITSDGMSQALQFAQSSFGIAANKLEEGKGDEAVSYQKEAAELVQESLDRREQVRGRFAYIAQIVDFVYRKKSQATIVHAIQKKLTYDAITNKDLSIEDLLLKQKANQPLAKAFGDDMLRVTKMGHYLQSWKFMNKAVEQLKANNREAAIAEMTRAEGAMQVDKMELGVLLTYIMRVPGTSIHAASDEVAFILETVDFANLQNHLTRQLWMANSDEKANWIQQQKKLVTDFSDTVKRSGGIQELSNALQSLGDVLESLDKDKKACYLAQRDAEAHMRSFIMNFSMNYVRLGRGRGFKKKPWSDPFKKPDLLAEVRQAEKFDIFRKMAATGQDPDDQGSEWEVLGKRERASLNENFARELPLEYRELLKDYYESLAK